nr:acyltransferase family protein [Ruegeria sp. HKCCA6837]
MALRQKSSAEMGLDGGPGAGRLPQFYEFKYSLVSVLQITYRPEIDGLRTIAVLSVLIYHAKFDLGDKEILIGGFLGVDVFFVISGFLVTSIIQKEWASTQKFSFINFYERRARRLLPALFLVIFATWPIAWILLLPSPMVEFVKSQLASVFFISNMFWWDASLTYGARPGLVQPFLHTWSLAVEEQFYLIFPLLYLAVLRFARRDVTILALGIAGVTLGLVFAEFMSQRSWTLSFFWLPSRLWELLAGGVLAHLLARFPGFMHSAVTLRIMPPIGLFCIIVPLLVMDVHWHHPGLGTLVPVLGTVLIIWFANPSDPVTRLLSSMPFVAVGLISYSLYLWHYPIFAFGRILEYDPGVSSKTVWFALSFTLAFLSYRFVERPFRRRSVVSLKQLSVTLVSATLVCALFASYMISTDGLRARLSGLIALYGPNEFDNEHLQAGSWEPLARLAREQGYAPSEAHSPSKFEATALWFSPDFGGRKILIIGNSHSKDLFNVFHLSQARFPEFEFARFGMKAEIPAEQVDVLMLAPNLIEADVVALSFRYNRNSLPRMKTLIRKLLAQQKKVVLLLNSVEFDKIDGMPIFDWYLQKSGEPFSVRAVNKIAWENRDLSKTSDLNRSLRQIARELNVQYLDKSEFICDVSAETCSAVTETGMKSFYDYGHFTLDGARYFGRRASELNWLALDHDAAKK